MDRPSHPLYYRYYCHHTLTLLPHLCSPKTGVGDGNDGGDDDEGEPILETEKVLRNPEDKVTQDSCITYRYPHICTHIVSYHITVLCYRIILPYHITVSCPYHAT